MSNSDWDDDPEFSEEELEKLQIFDISDLAFKPTLSRDRKTFTLTINAKDRELCLMRIYLALSERLVQMGYELGIYDNEEEQENH